MSTYVINNRIPKFPIKQNYADPRALQQRLEAIFQVWLKERFISNLIRRKTCSQIYDFSVWMEFQQRCIESSRPEHFGAWCLAEGYKPLSDWADFLNYARIRIKDLDWDSLN